MVHQGRDEDSTASGGDDATRILVRDSDDATRLVHPGGDERRGAVIGRAKPPTNDKVQPPGSSDTVFIPAGLDPFHDQVDPVVGWLVVRHGPGRGRFCPIFYGQNSLGRGADQRIRVDFGDKRISREAHAFIVYDDVAQKFYLRDGGKTNLVRHNGELVMTPTELRDRDEVMVGETTLLFIALCGPQFDWMTVDAKRPGETK
jgi:hypothetical protein